MQYVETLQEQLADLESSGRIPPNLLDAYQKRTETLSGMLRRAEVPDLCRLLSSMQVAKAAAAAGGGARDSGPVAMDTSGSGPAHASSARPSALLLLPHRRLSSQYRYLQQHKREYKLKEKHKRILQMNLLISRRG